MDLPDLPDLTKVRATANKALGLRDALDQQIQENHQKIQELENEEELLDLVANLIVGHDALLDNGEFLSHGSSPSQEDAEPIPSTGPGASAS